jgi:SAM-dependent methyltransferase
MTDADPWLERWLVLIAQRAAGRPVLELGCGGGRDSATLAAAGLAVIGIDRSPEAVARARARVPGATFHVQDVRAPFPVDAGIGVILASLSLHYFDWPETIALTRRIRDHLRPGGIVLAPPAIRASPTISTSSTARLNASSIGRRSMRCSPKAGRH